jgi:predicted DNA-binding protein
MLRDFAQITLNLARGLESAAARVQHDLEQSEAAPTPQQCTAVAGFSLALSRLSKVLLETLSTAARLPGEHAANAHRRAAAKSAARAAAVGEAVERSIARKQHIAMALDAACVAQHGQEDIAALRRGIADRLIEIDNVDFADIPVTAIVDHICTDLGIAPDWPRWSHLPWAKHPAAPPDPATLRATTTRPP